MPLFAGLQGVNTVRAAKVARERGAHELQITRDEVAMQTMKAYVDVLYYIGTTEIAAQQLEDSRLLLKEVEKLYEIGRKSAADVADVKSQEANYDYLLIEQQNNLTLAKIRLRELMNYPQDEELVIVEDIKAEFVNMENQAAYDSFLNQFRNNIGSYVQFGLSIPIFSGLNRRTSSKIARNAWRDAEFDYAAVRNAVESEVTQSYQQMKAYAKQYILGQKKLEAAQLAYEGISAKFEKDSSLPSTCKQHRRHCFKPSQTACVHVFNTS